MRFDAEKTKVLVERFSSFRTTRGCAPPFEVLHPFMLLAGLEPQLLVAEFIQQKDDEPTLWNIASLDGSMVTVVSGVGPARDWYLELHRGFMRRDEPAAQVDARTFPLNSVTGVRVSQTQYWGPPQLLEANAGWVIEHDAGAFTLPGAGSDEAEEFAGIVLKTLKQRASSAG
ncbi:hypothetical protein IDH50_11120 [Aeromicrobium tamlense]|uniref:Uncharacterized protein n=1 Tax=Aeromicrobium tamlense TaxID=375541 RepID=A0A8I0G0P6_9ACTN|nr:hypothetical protein [Aeromicrobium tamlense]MBD1270784.1 hypothetical protein [Aeromicrobium tamlense]NYI38176.1 hypothetical protein [Aeromicrobium tamlense]